MYIQTIIHCSILPNDYERPVSVEIRFPYKDPSAPPFVAYCNRVFKGLYFILSTPSFSIPSPSDHTITQPGHLMLYSRLSYFSQNQIEIIKGMIYRGARIPPCQ